MHVVTTTITLSRELATLAANLAARGNATMPRSAAEPPLYSPLAANAFYVCLEFESPLFCYTSPPIGSAEMVGLNALMYLVRMYQ